MATAKDLLKQSEHTEILYTKPGETILSALKMLEKSNIGALLVMEENKVVGILSERDIVRKVDLKGKTSATTLVKEVMTARVLYVKPEQSLEECMALMTEKNIRHLPIIDDDKLLGLISIRDVLREIIHEQKFMISQLEHYIRGS